MILKNGIELYHASYTPIKKIDLSLCASGKDFGKGFYVTADYHQACRFLRTAIGKAIKNKVPNVNEKVGYVSIFEYELCPNSDIKYHEFKTSDVDWLHCIVAHRKHGILYSELSKWKYFDIIAGKIANDSTNQVLTAYINGFYGEVGTYEADETAIKFLLPENLSNQICFRSEKSLTNLCFKDFKIVELEKFK